MECEFLTPDAEQVPVFYHDAQYDYVSHHCMSCLWNASIVKQRNFVAEISVIHYISGKDVC